MKRKSWHDSARFSGFHFYWFLFFFWYDFLRSATSSRLLLWRCRGHPPTWGWSQLNITWSRFASNMVKYDHPVCLKYTSLIKIIETTTLARWSGTHPLRTVWQSTDRGKYKIMFKNKFRHWEKVSLDLVVFQKSQVNSVYLFLRSHYDLRHKGTSSFLLRHNPADVQLVAHSREQRPCWEASWWSAGTLSTPGHLSKMT